VSKKLYQSAIKKIKIKTVGISYHTRSYNGSFHSLLGRIFNLRFVKVPEAYFERFRR